MSIQSIEVTTILNQIKEPVICQVFELIQSILKERSVLLFGQFHLYKASYQQLTINTNHDEFGNSKKYQDMVDKLEDYNEEVLTLPQRTMDPSRRTNIILLQLSFESVEWFSRSVPGTGTSYM